MNAQEARVSLLIQLPDAPGTLANILRLLSQHQVNLTHIESRPARGGYFDFYVDCEGHRDDASIDAAITALHSASHKLLVLDHKQVPWFPRQIEELDLIADRTLDAGIELQSDHPGFSDVAYRARRHDIDQLARAFRIGQTIPTVTYSDEEHDTWRNIYTDLAQAHERYACAQYLRNKRDLEQHCGYADGRIPQANAVSDYLRQRTGFQLRPVTGLLSPRDFLNGLAFKVFFCTQYIRHPSKPQYTPEPDVCHELIGHVPMFADPAFAELSCEIGLASLGASDEDIAKLARCYWFSAEFGLLKQDDQHKAYGAGLLSSLGELPYACSGNTPPSLAPWQPERVAQQDYPITEYQPHYFVADGLYDAREKMRAFCQALSRPFYARYQPATARVWVDRAVRRQKEAN